MSENLTAEELADLKAKAEKEIKHWRLYARPAARGLPDWARNAFEKAAATTEALLTALEEAETENCYLKVGQFVDSETIAELMEAGDRTWMPIALAKPNPNGSLIVMTSDEKPVIGQAFWHQDHDGAWGLYWTAVSPTQDSWNDPISETNKPIVCFQPLPEGSCEARVNAMVSASATIEALTARAEKAEQMAAERGEIIRRAQEELRLIRSKDTNAVYDTTLRLDMSLATSPSKSESDSNGK